MKQTIAAAYDEWSHIYDHNENKTRDLDAHCIRKSLGNRQFRNALELGCGTGKNTVYLAEVCAQLTAIDLSEGMLKKAAEKITAPHVTFVHGDLQRPLVFPQPFDLVCCNLVLEHIEFLEPVFAQVASILEKGGSFFLSELHPFKQYAGSKARFERGEEIIAVTCFTHHVSDFMRAAAIAGLTLRTLEEWFDDNSRESLPRLLSMEFKKL